MNMLETARMKSNVVYNEIQMEVERRKELEYVQIVGKDGTTEEELVFDSDYM